MAAAIEMGRRGYHVIAAGRSSTKVEATLETVRRAGGSAEGLIFDMASLADVIAATEQVLSAGRPIDVLVANAGVGGVRGFSADGFELHFAVNHLAHFALYRGISSAIPSGGRVVVVSSEAHRGATDPGIDSIRSKPPVWRVWGAYGRSKLANILFTRRLASIRPDIGTYAVHPGVVDTNIFPGFTGSLLRNKLTPEEGAAPVVRCASDAETAGQTGVYYRKHRLSEPSDIAKDDDLATRLWELSESLISEAEGPKQR